MCFLRFPVLDVPCLWTSLKIVSSIPRLLVPPRTRRDRRPDWNCNLRVFPTVFVSVFSSVFCFRSVPLWIPPFALNSSSSCWSRGSIRSRTISDCFWPSRNSPATRTTRSAHSMTQASTPHAERCRPKMVLERNSPPSWSGLWRETDRPSQSPKRMISPDPLQTQSPAHHLPAVRSTSPSPPMTESHFPPQSASQR